MAFRQGRNEGFRQGRSTGGFRESKGRDFYSNPPVNVGDEIEVTIEAVGEKGDGVAKKDGFVLFVPNTREGERVKVKVTKVLKKVGFAEKIGEATGEQPAEKSEEPAQEEEEQEESSPEESEDFGEEDNSEPMDDLEEEPEEE